MTDYQVFYLDRWKGKDKIEIRQYNDHYLIILHRKNKENNDIKELNYFVPRIDVINLYKLVKKYPLNEKHRPKDLWRLIILDKNIHIAEGIEIDTMINSFNGGTNRAKYYFPLYYYPLKILEGKGIIKYYGRGDVERII